MGRQKVTWAGACRPIRASLEAWVGDEAAPAGADEGRAGEGGRQRGEAEEDLGEEVVDVDRGRPEADHLVPCRLGRPKINRKGSVGEDARGGQTPTPASGQQGRGVLVVHDAGDGAAGDGRRRQRVCRVDYIHLVLM